MDILVTKLVMYSKLEKHGCVASSGYRGLKLQKTDKRGHITYLACTLNSNWLPGNPKLGKSNIS